VVVVVVLVVLIASLGTLATIYTDALWFNSVGRHQVWSTLFFVKVGLFLVFGFAFFVALWVNLIVCERMAASAPPAPPEDELVRRYQRVIRPYAGRVYAALALLLALVAAGGTVGQWQNWLLFRYGGNFGVTDPQFHKDVGFYVFKLPFITFLIHWVLASLVVILIATGVFHYLNGGIRAQRVSPRIRPSVKAHLSLLLALMALTKAAGYWFQRYQLTTSTDGYVEGAGYTDVHARLPAIQLLFLISVAAAVVLIVNIWRQGWVLPVLAIGVWAIVAAVIGVVYPAALQALKVTPAQSTLEAPYIHRNIEATRAAYDLKHIRQATLSGQASVTSAAISQNLPTLQNVRLWDPDPSIAQTSFQKLQSVQSYYAFAFIGMDRYTVHNKLTPALVGVREVNAAQLPATGWVNTHLQYTHGEGFVMAAANNTAPNGNPDFTVRNIPSSSTPGYPKVTQPGVYFGVGETGYVVAHTKQQEFSTQGNGGAYQGTGGVKVGGLFNRLAFSIRLKDFNLLISSLITDQSRIMFVRDPVAMAQKAAPFLSFDSNPYAAVVNGHIDWIIDGYTTSAGYPYAQNADTQNLPPGSGLPASYNYVRNSVKVVVDAYSGKMTFYDWDPSDPVLKTYTRAFPGMFKPPSDVPAALRVHLRYPSDMFAAQAATYGRYHITQPSAFYSAGDRWQLTPSDGAGPVSQSLPSNSFFQQPPMQPLYQVSAIPGTTDQAFTTTEAYVPATENGSTPNPGLAALLIANSNPGSYGHLTVFKSIVQGNQRPTGPLQADAYISQNQNISQKITLLDQHGSQVLLGNVLIVPIGQSVLYVRPMYTEARANPQPQLKYILAVYGQNVGFESSLDAALSDVLNSPVSGTAGSGANSSTPPPSTGTGSKSSNPAAAAAIAAALKDYAQAQSDLKAGNLGAYQQDVSSAAAEMQKAQQDLAGAASNSTSSGTTTTTAPTRASSSTTTTAAHRATTTTTKPKSNEA
jgi:uncharacterized membrane protein (UPF0182 family)